ncbi:alpha/beta hydrolase [Methylocystis sp.]|uniref:alpha/beta hydrolase n=1 Tax=Methylocystis sp. TaxID=1911079 RepID=UPI003DA57C74
MAHFELLAPARGTHRASVIFFHGLGGDLHETWTSPDSTVWPNWIAEDIDGLSIYLVGYEAPMSKWQGRGSGMHPVDHANAILQQLDTEPGLANGDLYLVGHSLGGLIIKMMMRRAKLSQSSAANSFVQRVRKVAFLATPHTGADLGQIANLLRVLTRRSPATESLARNDPDLRALNEDYRKIAQEPAVQHLILSEREELILRKKFLGFDVPVNLGVIVKPDNADPGVNVDPIPISVDHIQIAKPNDRNDEIYRYVRAFLQRPTTPTERNDSTNAETGRPLATVKIDGTSQRIESQSFDISRIDSYAPEKLIGREAETKIIDDAWATTVRGEANRPRVVTFVAMGGEGKTSLVADWVVRKQIDGWPECEAAFAWSFFSQGTRDQYAGDSDLFLAEALKFFGGETKEGEGAVEKARRLARLIGEKRTLFILDGLEPLQYPSGPPHDGRLKDDAIVALLKWLAANGKALFLVTTRVAIIELQAGALEGAAPQHDLTRLSSSAGVALLRALGVWGSKDEFEALVEETNGHALTLTFLGSYLKRAHQGDIRRFDRVEWDRASKQYKNDHAFRAMATYEKFLIHGDAAGAREIAILRLMGLFDRPADVGCLKALLGKPIANLNEALVAANEDDFNLALDNLQSEKLLTVNRDAGGALVSLDGHPLLREFFAKELRENNPEGWKAAHKRLYEYLCATEAAKKDAPTLDDLRPLYQAVAHGCHAGLQQEACDQVYSDRILRGTGQSGFYSTKKLGAFGAQLGAVACFFDTPWTRLSPNLSPSDQAWLLAVAAFDLHALGRLREALEPMRVGLAMRITQENWSNAAISACNISELALTLGDVAEAARAGAESVGYADRSEDDFLRRAIPTSHADALHQQGALDEARGLFAKAEAMQVEIQPEYPLLYSRQGSCYCDLLLGPSERAAWRRILLPCANSQPGGLQDLPSLRAEGETVRSSGAAPRWLRSARNDDTETLAPLLDACANVEKRAEQALGWFASRFSRLSVALDHLTLARAALYAVILRDRAPNGAHVDAAVNGLRDAGRKDCQPLGLLTRALYRVVAGDFPGARDDLDEAYDIAERGPMKLHLADIHLHRARLFGLYAERPEKYPWDSPMSDLAEARRLIEECGYWRRKEELEDAEAALRALH